MFCLFSKHGQTKPLHRAPVAQSLQNLTMKPLHQECCVKQIISRLVMLNKISKSNECSSCLPHFLMPGKIHMSLLRYGEVFQCQSVCKKNKTSPNSSVLGLARTGLIFTRIQEGAQPGGLTPPGQTEQGIPYHVPSCWVPLGGSWVAGTHSQLGRAQRRFGPRKRFCSVGSVLLVCFVYSPFLYRCCSCSLCLLFC